MPRDENMTPKKPIPVLKRASINGEYICTTDSEIKDKIQAEKDNAPYERAYSALTGQWTVWSEVKEARRSGRSSQVVSASSSGISASSLSVVEGCNK